MKTIIQFIISFTNAILLDYKMIKKYIKLKLFKKIEPNDCEKCIDNGNSFSYFDCYF